MTDFDPFSTSDEKQETDPVSDFLVREEKQLAELNGRSYTACVLYSCIVYVVQNCKSENFVSHFSVQNNLSLYGFQRRKI